MDLSQITEHCQYLLYNSPSAQATLSYLNNRLSTDLQKQFNFGYFPPLDQIYLLTELTGEESLFNEGLLYYRSVYDTSSPQMIKTSYFNDYPLMIPYRDVYGKTIALVGRTLLDEETRKQAGISKYKNTVFKKGQHLFGLYESKAKILELDYVYVVEGQFDVIKGFEGGITNIVALGNSNMTDYQFSLLSRYTKNIFLLLDNDAAGEKGRSVIDAKFAEYANFSHLYIPDGYKDLDDYLTENDSNSLPLIARNSRIFY